MDIFVPFELYREKSKKLLDSTFAEEMKKPNGVNITWTEEGQISCHTGPNQEFIDAYLLTFRFFIQGNESVSFKNMGKNFEYPEINQSYLHRFNEVREVLNEYLDGKTMFVVSEPLTRRKLMETFIFGDLGHANREEKRNEFLKWSKNELMIELMKNEFRDILARVLIAINQVYLICGEVLDERRT